MKPLSRTLGVFVLELALLNASAGLCFCHRGPEPPGDSPAPAGCCHGPDLSGKTAVAAASDCCHIEAAESAAKPVAAAQLAPPTAPESAIAAEPSSLETLPSVARALPGASPPLFALRV